MEESFQEQVRRQALEATVKAVQEKVGTLTCPTHGEHPKLQFSEDSGPGHQKMSFDCCCDALAKMLQEKLKT